MFLKLSKSNDSGEPRGVLVVNTDNIAVVEEENGVTSIQLVNGSTRWVKESAEELWKLVKPA